VKALLSPEIQTRFASLMAEPAPTSPQAFSQFMSSERDKYESIVKASGARID
jgi:tripartite-type tricarboxylate transporter receptor subunit TctC